MWVPNPNEIVPVSRSGSSDMGDASQVDFVAAGSETPNNTNYEARFYLEEAFERVKFTLAWLRVHFSLAPGGTGGTADLNVVLASRLSQDHNVILWTFTGVGEDSDVNFRVPAEELMHWVCQPGDSIVLEWTNPDDGSLVWGAEAGLVKVG